MQRSSEDSERAQHPTGSEPRALAGREPFDAAAINVETDDVVELLSAVAWLEPDLPLIVLAANCARAIALVRGAGIEDFAICRRWATSADLSAALRAARASVQRV
jgi:hypothetical protein